MYTNNDLEYRKFRGTMNLTRRDFIKTGAIVTGSIIGMIPEELINKEVSMPERKYVIESRRYIGEDGKTTFDSWITSSNVIEVKQADQYLVFYPLEGEYAGKKMYIPFSNIHIVREL